jgi:hypothetical protein
LNFTTFTLFNDSFYFFFSYSSVSGGFIQKYLMKFSWLCNQINGAVTMETIFIGIATALAIASGWFNPILLGSNSLD